jgi:predicted transcriptional regulator
MKHPQEIEVWYIIPAIRREMASIMKERGLKNKEVAKALDVSDAAVSQYGKSKRGCEVIFPKDVKERIELASERVIKDPSKLVGETQAVCELVKDEGILCKVHRRVCKDLEECSICIRKK